MDYHQNARLTVHSREQIAKMIVEQGCSQKAAAAAFCVSAKTAAKWVRRYRLGDHLKTGHTLSVQNRPTG
jgi:transposase